MRAEALGAAVAALALLAGPVRADPITVQVNGEPVRFAYAQPTQVAGRVMIPLRGVLERLGAERIAWRPQQQAVVVSSAGHDIRLRIGDRTAMVDGRRVALDVPPLILENTTMVPLRFVSENLGARVDWMPAERTVYIATPNERVAGARERFPNGQYGTRTRSRSDEMDTTGQGRPLPRREPSPGAIPADRGGTLRSPYLESVFPAQGTTIDNPRPEVFVRFRPNASIDFHSVHVWVNNREVTPDAEVTVDGLRYQSDNNLRRGRNDVRVSFRDRQGVLTTQEWYFFTP